MMKKIAISLFFILMLINAQILRGQNEKPYAYLFAHMTKEDYGRLYYSVSKDGLKWEFLNNEKRVHAQYRGHPDIMQGHDGRYYMIGVEDSTGQIPLWASKDMTDWQEALRLPTAIFDGKQTPNYIDNPRWYGAPKMFYDTASQQYIIT